jgi:hypothetical protein
LRTGNVQQLRPRTYIRPDIFRVWIDYAHPESLCTLRDGHTYYKQPRCRDDQNQPHQQGCGAVALYYMLHPPIIPPCPLEAQSNGTTPNPAFAARR